MSDDRNARGLEDRVELFDRLFFCRSFHSKLSPVGGLRFLRAGPPGCTHRPAHQTLDIGPGKRRARRHLEACPPISLAAVRGVEVRTKSATHCLSSVTAK